MINLRPAKSVQGKVELPVSPDMLYMAALGACAASKRINVCGVGATGVVDDIIKSLQSHASIQSDGSMLHVDPLSVNDPGILLALPESLLPYRSIYLFMGLGMGKTVTARSISEKQIQDAIAQGKRMGITVEAVQVDDMTGLRATYFDSGIAESANIGEDDCTALLAFLFGKGEKLTFTITDYHLSTPLRQLAGALGLTLNAKLSTSGGNNDFMAKRLRFLQGKQRDSSSQSLMYVVETDFSKGNVTASDNGDDAGKPVNIVIPGDEILAAALITLKCLIPKGEFEISNVPMENWASQAMQFIKKTDCKLNTHDDGKTSFGVCGTVSVKKGDGYGRKVRCAPLYQYIGQLPCMAVTAAFSQGKSVFRELGVLRSFEPDGIDQLEKCLRPLGVRHGEMPDGIVMEGAKDFDGFDLWDPLPAHIAVAFCAAGLKCLGKTSVADEHIAARWPNFETMINEICEFRNK
ncbi:MAG: hypothetical protein FWB85_00085 [Chitinispirillia bacterium]|nr:hypothetical protein [Chitinispirillia bacterium]MCL2240908.1 hypothetical protein [Chitinispirillia bacterium]